MYISPSTRVLSYILGSFYLSQAAQAQTCKPLPDEAHWPDATAWNALNSSISGRLVATIPPGAVCHTEWPEYDSAKCSALSSQWSNTTFHTLNPVSVNYNDVTCLPVSNSSCSASGYPAYVIQASSAGDVQAGINFANATGVRLIIKGTGHDYPGRSSGAGSLSIHTSGMRGLELNRNDSRAASYGGVGSLKIHAGEQFGNVNKFAAANSFTVISGSDPGVGVGGWITAGGHGPLTAKFGLGSDQVLEMDVVTPDGKARTIDADHDADLFWAMRGGGGSTFAAMTSVTVVVYPPVIMSEYMYSYNTTANSDTFWSMVAYFSSQVPTLSEAGLMGYYYATPDTSTEKNDSMKGKLSGIWLAPGKTSAEIKNMVEPVEKKILSGQWADSVVGGGYSVGNVTFASEWSSHTPEPVGQAGRLGSRLLDQTALEGDQHRLRKALRTSTSPPYSLIGHAVAGPGTRLPAGGMAASDNSALSAWRRSYVHLVLSRSWPAQDLAAKERVTQELRDTETAALTDLAPNTGAYRNEADPTTAGWQQTFYGDDYARLLEIKQKWDPKGIFWCKACVGSELWTVNGKPDSESGEVGIGQDKVRLCKQ